MQNSSPRQQPPIPAPASFADAVIQQAEQIKHYLRTLPDAAPHPQLNDMIKRFVDLVRVPVDPAIAEDVLNRYAHVQEVQEMLSVCEFEFEKFWAKKICRREASYKEFSDIETYLALVAAEAKIVDAQMNHSAPAFCFIGSGPMPLTAFGMKEHLPASRVQCVERDAGAFLFGKNVTMESKIDLEHVLADAVDVNYSTMDIIFVASMVDNKRAVLDAIAATARPGTLVGVRTVEGLRQFLYMPLDERDVPGCFEYVDKTPYQSAHVNTTLFYRLK